MHALNLMQISVRVYNLKCMNTIQTFNTHTHYVHMGVTYTNTCSITMACIQLSENSIVTCTILYRVQGVCVIRFA